ncbi:MAG TPA: hypothetical protein VFQ78_13505 [Candidatus Udaeobacter sp.]|jgi:hypothetical protein|nr:hypothetical protein [Candidatus Udaeobacter sp.]
MKTTCRLARLFCVGTVLSMALCVTAFADSDHKNVVTQREDQVVQKPRRVIYYVKTTASAVPQPIERLGGIPTTTIPMLVIGDPRISNN